MFRPSYVTRSVQQAYGIEHPIGDPFGGAAYGELNGGGSFGKILSSAIPMIAGAAMMLTPGAPLGAMLIGGAMFAGGAMSGIGAITGNQTLSKIGGITSAVAGVAGMGYSVYSNWDSISNFFSSGTELAGTAAAGAEGATGTMADIPGLGWNTAAAEGMTAAPSVAGNFAGAQTSAAFAGGGYDAASFAGELGNQMNLASSTPLNMQTGNMLASAQGTVDAGGVANAINTGGMSSIPGIGNASSLAQGSSVGSFAPQASSFGGGSFLPTGSAAPLPGSSFGSGAATVDNVGGFAANAGNTGGSTGLLSSVGSFIEKNPTASMMGLQAVGGMMEGASPKSQAEGEYLQAMADMKQAEQAYLEAVKAPETAANTAYLLEKAKEFDKTKAYEEEKRAAYNASIAALQAPQTQNLAQTMYGGAQTGLINQAKV